MSYTDKKFRDWGRDELSALGDYKLCYAERGDVRDCEGDAIFYTYWLYFTPIRMEDQWGDDWDDAPYEYNAEKPYDSDYVDGKWVEHNILVLDFAVKPEDYLELPCDYSSYCVADINSGKVAWLFKPSDGKCCNGIAVHAGLSPEEVMWKIGHLMFRDNGTDRKVRP